MLAAEKKTAALRASQEFDDKVVFGTVDTLDKDVVRKCGEVSALIVDGWKVRTGPSPSYEKIRDIMAGRVGTLGRSAA